VRALIRSILATAFVTSLVSVNAVAQIAVSANDGKMMLVDGVNTPRPDPQPDTVTIIDVSVMPPKILAEVRAPTSVAGPPHSVAISRDRSIALVTASMKIDPNDPKTAIPNDQVTVIDLKASPPVVLKTLQAGAGASGVSINPAGTLALVANRYEGTVSVFSIEGKNVTSLGKVDFAAPDSQPAQAMFLADGRTALISRSAATDNKISVLAINGTKVEYTKQDLFSGLQPYGMDITPAGDFAVVANIGTGFTGGADTVSLLDLKANPPRTIDQLPVGPIPEGIVVSPNGRYVAVTVMNGTNLSKSSPFYHDYAVLKVLEINGRKLLPVAETRIGRWCQGAAWTPNGATVLAQCMVEKEIQMFGFDGKSLKPAGSIKVNGGPGGLRTAR
jgi:DNA-binding beta-propeller fold protein YncE